jgi:hypothetical protein
MGFSLEYEQVSIFSGSAMDICACLQTKEWAMVGSLGNDESTWVIPQYHRALPRPEALLTASDFYQRVDEAGLKTQNYDKGFDEFVRKFNPKEEMTAPMAMCLGCQ